MMKDVEILIDLEVARKEVEGVTWELSRGGGDEGGMIAMRMGDDCDGRLVERSVGEALSMLRGGLSEWGGVVSEDGVVSLCVPCCVGAGALDEAGAWMHRLVVDYAVGEWLRVIAPAAAEGWVAKAQVDRDGVDSALCRRRRPSRPVLDDDGNRVFDDVDNKE